MSISPGVYRIKNAEAQTMLELERSEGSGICVRQQNDQTNQHWFVHPSGDGVVLKNVESGQYAYAPITSLQNGCKLFGSSTPITWKFVPNGNEWLISLPGSKFIVEHSSGGNRADGIAIQLWEYVGRKYQRWTFEKLK
ncbi:unnamed protein product [Rhizoctonia solani]|uniref:Ricin B lectin domain-containing protein n=1 Tax=Rhizoctonia solani TaxID=456999 RepID=A0A8H3EA65_9AGAM|nr:unnamed protein product [Rhizoctonia solani]